ncbi:MAG: response regulator [Planctomycetaceae bacterium]|nr:response regulator [Planctomycetaceae bacterium]
MVGRPEKTYRMLLADDDRGFRESLRLLFEPFFELLEADSGEQTIEIVEHHSVDIVLIDMHMDVLTGIETVQRIRPIIAAAPCILVTADATDELRREADVHAVLSKPVEKQELVTTVSTALHDAYDDPDPFHRWA